MISAIVSAALVVMMLRVGFDVPASEIIATVRNYRLIAWTLVANYVFVPAITVALLLLLRTSPMVAVGFLVLSVCPGAPFGPPLTAIAKGNVGVSAGLMAILAASSAILAPLLLLFLLPYVSTAESLHVNPIGMVRVLVATQLLPLFIGVSVRLKQPHLAARLKPFFGLVANVLLIVVFLAVLAIYYRMLIQIRLTGVAAMVGLSISSLTVGWFAGGSDQDTRKAAALTTAFRNAGVGMVIASSSFGSAQVLVAVVAYTLVSIGGTLIPALYWGKAGITKVPVVGGQHV